MYAIFEDGGRQYKVSPGQQLTVDFRDLAAGQALSFDRVVAYSDGSSLQIGKPTLAGAKVSAQVLGAAAGPKLVVQKFRRRKTFRKKTGHRQKFTMIKIDAISV